MKNNQIYDLCKKIQPIYRSITGEGNRKTLTDIEKKIKVDNSVIRHLTVKYKKLDTKIEYFNKKDKQ